MERYHTFSELYANKLYPIKMESNENFIGVFENNPNRVEESIVITDQGLHYCFDENESKKIKYIDILNTSCPKPEEKRSAEILTLYLSNDETFSLLIKRTSEDQRFNNLFGFMRFIDRVRSDMQRFSS